MEFAGGQQVYSESGVDLTLLRRNLGLSVSDRLLRNARMLPLLAELAKGAIRNEAERHGRGLPMLEVEALLHVLVDNQIEFVLIGGLAMRAHGSAHVTEDMDVCYSRTGDSIAALARALGPIHPYMRGAPTGLPFRFDSATIQAGLNFTLQTDLGDLDFLGEVSGVGAYPQAQSMSVERDLFGMKVRVLSVDGLLAAKRASGRVKDRNHILELEELKKLGNP